MSQGPYPESGSIHLTIVSNLPPPVHGVSVFNQQLLVELDRAGVPYNFCQVGSTHAEDKTGRFSVRKVLRDALALAGAAIRAARLPRGKTSILYFTPSQGGPGVYRDLVVGWIGRLLFDRVVAHLHGCGWIDIQQANKVRGWVMWNALNSSDAVICLGPSFSRRLHERTGLDCIPVNNGTFPIPGSTWKRLPGDGPIHLLFLGSLLPDKGVHVAAGAARVLRTRGHNVALRCVGPWRRRSDEVTFLEMFRPELDSGVIEVRRPVTGTEKEDLLRRAHVLMLPTTYSREGQPLVLVEAMSCGAVPMTTDHAGIADLFQFPGADRLYSNAFLDSEKLASAVEWLIQTPERFEQMSRACYEHFLRQLTFSECAGRLLTVMRSGSGTSVQLGCGEATGERVV